MKIILIGFMGSGKSTVGKMLAGKLELPFIDMDPLTVERSGRRSVSEIFEKDGEINFRKMEMLVAKDLQNNEDLVIATGGGIVMNKLNLDLLKMHRGKVVFLQTSFETVKKRLHKDIDRPLFEDKEAAKKLYDFREVLYLAYSDVVINTDEKSITEVVDEVVKALRL